MIFPSQRKGRNPIKTVSGVRPDSGRSGSRPAEMDNGGRSQNMNSASAGQNTNAIEDLVKERAGVDPGKEMVGPPIAECIAEQLKTYLKEQYGSNVEVGGKLSLAGQCGLAASANYGSSNSSFDPET